MEVEKEWQHQAVALANTETVSWRGIAKLLGVPRTTCSDFLRKYYSIRNDAEEKESKVHLYIPDNQVKDGVDLDYLEWIGKYIVRKRPDVIVNAGDFADMESLSSYDKGMRTSEGKRVQRDIDAAVKGMETLLKPLRDLQAEQRAKGEEVYSPRMVLTLGNHEDRINRHVNANPELHGFLSIESLKYDEFGWEVIPFLTPITIDGVSYCHYYANPMTGKPYGGSAANILSKVGTSFVQGHKQTLDVTTRFLPHNGQQQWGITAGACLEENHKVLTADLQYKRLGDIVVGDSLISFEEEVTNKRSRRYQKGTVLAVRKIEKEVLKVSLESGKVFFATPDHKWFVKTGSAYRWAYTTELRKGTCIPKLFQEWDSDTSFEAGWLSGIYDGEGSLHQRKTTGGNCFQLAVSQKPGAVYDNIVKILKQRFSCEVTENTNSRGVGNIRIKGGVNNVVKVLGSIRPMRLLSKFDPDNMGRICCPDTFNDKVVSIEPAGIKNIVEIDIDKKTMIVEGYGHHNCYTHEEDYKGVQGNKHWRGILVFHNVHNGSFDPLFISLDWLKKEYSK